MPDDVSAYAAHAFIADLHNNSWSNIYNFVPAGTRVLDVGCSTGNLGAALIALKSCTVVGVDVNAADIEIAKGVLSDAVVLDVSAESAIESLGTFDVIVFADVLEHLADPRSTLRSIHRLLNPGGLIVYSIPHMAHASIRLDLLEGQFPYTETGLLDKTHFHYYDRAEVASLMTDGGFDILDEDPVVIEYPQPWLVERLSGLGLVPNEKFFSLLASTEAQVFHFVGYAKPADRVPKFDGPARHRPMPTDEVLVYYASLRAEHAEVLGQLTSLHEKIMQAKRNPVAFVWRRVTARLGRRTSSDDS